MDSPEFSWFFAALRLLKASMLSFLLFSSSFAEPPQSSNSAVADASRSDDVTKDVEARKPKFHGMNYAAAVRLGLPMGPLIRGKALNKLQNGSDQQVVGESANVTKR